MISSRANENPQQNQLDTDQQQHKVHQRAQISDLFAPLSQNEDDEHLYMEIIRVRSHQKQKKCLPIFTLTDKEVEAFFMSYEFYEGLNKKMSDLLTKGKGLKLVRNQNRIYFGETQKNKKHGTGVSVYSDGKIYQGEFVDNQKHGDGYEIYPNCNVYIGTFQKNKKHGAGAFYWFTVETNPLQHEQIQYYQGEWWGGLPSGRGFHQRANGDRYDGFFKNGLKHGQGFEAFSNGDTYKGQYVNGLPEGYGQYIWQDGSNYKGDFKQGVRNGFGIWKKDSQPQTESYRGHYLLDRKSGYGVYMWENGDYYKGEFFQDVRHGYGEFNNGGEQVYAGMWENGKQSPDAEIQKNANFVKQSRTAKQKPNVHHMSMQDMSEVEVIAKTNSKSTEKQYIQKQQKQHQRQELKGGKNQVHNNPLVAFKMMPNQQAKWAETKRKNQSANLVGNPQKVEAVQKRERIGHRNCIPKNNYQETKKFY